MRSSHYGQLERIHGLFNEELTSRGGEVIAPFADRQRLFLRGLLPGQGDVRPGDTMRSGLALRASETDVWLHPFTYRLVCRNGAIAARYTGTWHLGELDQVDDETLDTQLREAIALCCDPQQFAAQMHLLQTAGDTHVDTVLILSSSLAQMGRTLGRHRMGRIWQRFLDGIDRSLFGVMNAITAQAHEERDPETRWRLEEFGGGVPALLEDDTPDQPNRAARDLLAVG